MKYSIWRCMVFCLAVLVWAGSALADEVVADRILAVVNGKIITQYEFDTQVTIVADQQGRKLTSDERKMVLDRMITDILLELETQKYGIKVTDAEVKDAINALMEGTGMNEEALRKELQVRNLTYEKFFENKRLEIKKNRLVSGLMKVVVTDQEVEEEFKQRQSGSGGVVASNMLKLRFILLPPDVSASSVREQIVKKSMSFAEAADKYSKGPGAGQGGDLGIVDVKDLSAEWQNALKGLNVGDVSQPFRLHDGEALLMIDAKDAQAVAQADFESEKETIRRELYNHKTETFLNDYLNRLKEKAVIEYKK